MTAHTRKVRCLCTYDLKEYQCSPNAAAPYFRSGRQTAKWNKFSSDSICYQGVSEAEAAAADTRGAGKGARKERLTDVRRASQGLARFLFSQTHSGSC